jgi:hypothetical protein
MKHIIIALLCLTLLCGCAATPTTTTPVTTSPANTETTAASANTSPTKTEADAFALAESCIGKSVEDLYALIGQPQSADYAPSCLVEGAEDGNLYYEGFTVYTLRTEDGESVEYVE